MASRIFEDSPFLARSLSAKALQGMKVCAEKRGLFVWKSPQRSRGGLYPPFRDQFPKRDNAIFLIIEHDFNVLIMFRHELGHQFPAGAAGRNRFSVRDTAITRRI